MAQESESGASTAAAPAIETVLRQKTREGETSFTFHPDRLGYTFIGRRGTRVERHIAWNVVPPRPQLRRNARPDLRLHRGSRWAIVLLIFASVTRLSTHVSPLVLFTGYTVLLWGLTLLFSRRFRITSSVLPTSQGNIVILGDAAHDAILSRVLEGRRAYLRRFAVIDRSQSLRWNLQRLRWMFEQDVIARDDFVRAQQTLLPGVREPLLRPAPDVGPDRKIEQRFCNALFAFDFKTDHLAHRRRTGLGVERAITVKYLDLREPTAAVQVGTPSQLLSSTIFGLVLIGFGYVLEMLERLPSDALSGPGGLQRGLLLLGPGIGAIALAMVAASRVMRMVYTKLPRDIMILRNRQHDAVVAEISRRRRAALKALAEPNPLLGAQEQTNLLAALRREGILDDQDIPDILARAAALQKYLGLADPEPQQDRPLQSETPTPPAPRPTIH